MTVAVSRPRRRSTERGSGTVLAMVIIMVVVTALWVAGAVSAGVAARRSAAAAADLAALAVAQQANRGAPDPCSAGERVAAANGGAMVECVVIGTDAEVVVEVAVPGGVYRFVPEGRRRARAGPASWAATEPILACVLAVRGEGVTCNVT